MTELADFGWTDKMAATKLPRLLQVFAPPIYTPPPSHRLASFGLRHGVLRAMWTLQDANKNRTIVNGDRKMFICAGVRDDNPKQTFFKNLIIQTI